MTNQALQARSLASVWHPCTQMKQHAQFPLLPITRGEGVWLYDAENKRYLDAVSSWWVNLFGHNNATIKDAIKSQLDTLEHVMLAGFTHEPAVQLAEKLAALTGLGHSNFASDGASATEIALKMSFHYWRNRGQPQKNKFIYLQNSYHGETLGALGVTDVAIFKDTYAPLLFQGVAQPSPDWRLAEHGESPEAYAERCALGLANYLTDFHGQISAIILEPLVQCAGGMAMYHAAYLKRVRAICQQFEVHIIADEIAVGFGRTGTMFACEQAGEKVSDIADFICLSKGITGGYLPLSCVLTTDAIYQAFYDDSVQKAFLHSHSYTGNPLACSAALAVLAIFENENILAKNQALSAQIWQKMQALTHLPIANLRRSGMMFAFDVNTQNVQFARQCSQAALQHNLILRPIGNTVYWMPPYTISDEEIDHLVAATLHALEQTL